MLVSLNQLLWLPYKNQFYPASRLQLGPPPVCKFHILLLSLISQNFLQYLRICISFHITACKHPQ